MTTHQKEVVPASEIEEMTAPLELATGFAAENWASPRPDLAGARLVPLVGNAIYLVNPEGILQWIPNPATYNNLFRDWNGVLRVDIAGMAIGSPLSDGAVMAKGNLSAAVYLVSNGRKRWITSPAVMDKYYFNWSRIYTVPQVLIDPIPTGNNWS